MNKPLLRTMKNMCQKEWMYLDFWMGLCCDVWKSLLLWSMCEISKKM